MVREPIDFVAMPTLPSWFLHSVSSRMPCLTSARARALSPAGVMDAIGCALAYGVICEATSFCGAVRRRACGEGGANRRDVLGDGQLADVEPAIRLKQLVEAQVAVEGDGHRRASGLGDGGGLKHALLVDLRLRGVSGAAWRGARGAARFQRAQRDR